MQVKLKVQTGSHEGKEIGITAEKFLIGRSESCQLRPKSESISRKHCIIVLRDNRVLIHRAAVVQHDNDVLRQLTNSPGRQRQLGSVRRETQLEFEIFDNVADRLGKDFQFSNRIATSWPSSLK